MNRLCPSTTRTGTALSSNRLARDDHAPELHDGGFGSDCETATMPCGRTVSVSGCVFQTGRACLTPDDWGDLPTGPHGRTSPHPSVAPNADLVTRSHRI